MTDAKATNLPWPLASFLEAWSSYRTEAGIRGLSAMDPLWDVVPRIDERMDQVYTATFVGFWSCNGQLALPAVSTCNRSFREENRIVRRGQSIRDAFIKKGADWITVMTLSGRFEPIELVNLTYAIPRCLEQSGETAFREKISYSLEQRETYRGSQYGNPPCAWLDVYWVTESPPPLTLSQKIWSVLRHGK
jgi:hypothetical protein